MKNKELIEHLLKMNPEAEVGFEYQKITYVDIDENQEYIDLGGNGDVFDKTKIKSSGVFILKMGTKCIDTNDLKDTICGVFSTKERAEKMGTFLINATKVEPFTDDNDNKIVYLNYDVENFILL